MKCLLQETVKSVDVFLCWINFQVVLTEKQREQAGAQIVKSTPFFLHKHSLKREALKRKQGWKTFLTNKILVSFLI